MNLFKYETYYIAINMSITKVTVVELVRDKKVRLVVYKWIDPESNIWKYNMELENTFRLKIKIAQQTLEELCQTQTKQ